MEQTDVLVVGAGPAGISAALMLANLGVNAITVTKYPGQANGPRAHITNARTMEVFRDQGCEDALMAAATPQELMTNVCWTKRFTEPEIARFEAWGGGLHERGRYEAASPASMCNLPQHVLEPIVRDAAVAAGADIRYGQELVSFEQDTGGVTATLRARDGGAETQVRAKYMIGADGANSQIAETCGIAMRGQSGLGAAVTAWIEADLTEYVAHRPSVLYWVVQPGGETWLGTGCYVAVKPWTEWMLLFVVAPDEELDLTEARIRDQVGQHVGADVDVRLKSTGRWQVNSLVAEQYREGRVFLAGDAAHRHPPANGLGSNTSVQDSYNLCWKLAMVLRGEADAALLDTYDAERRPVGEQVVARAIESMGNLVPVMEALAKGGVDADGDVDVSGLMVPGANGAARRDELFDALQLQHWHFNALGVELGQFYRSAAVASEGQDRPDNGIDRQLHVVADTTPGLRLPHIRLLRDGNVVSSLDLVGKGRFTLLTGLDGADWAAAAADASERLGLPLDVEPVGLGQHNSDVYGEWRRMAGIEENGALLVRPDGHIAWRALTAPPDPAAALGTALAAVLSRSDAAVAETTILEPAE